MATYQGPHVAVEQKFVPTPGAVAVESLPPAIVATAFDVFRNEDIGSYIGIEDDKVIPWGADKVVYNTEVINQRAFEMFPPVAAASSAFGNIDLGINSDNTLETGVQIGRDDSYSIPGIENVAGTSLARIPFYAKTAVVKILSTDLDTVIITGGDVITAGLRPGQSVFINDGGWVNVGTIGSIGSDKTKINLSAPYSGAITGTDIKVGGSSIALIDRPNTLYDPSADFILRKVKPGDVLEFSSLAISASLTAPISATVTSVLDKNTIKFNTENLNALDAGNIDADYLKYKFSAEEPGATIRVYGYDIKRLIGFSENYQLKLLNSEDGVAVDFIGTNSFSADTGGIALSAGDAFILTADNPLATVEERDIANLRVYRIESIVYTGSVATITTDAAILRSLVSPDTPYEDGDYITAWNVKVESDIISSFRAIRTEENNVVKRIAQVQDIYDAWVNPNENAIDPMNELAFMMNIAFATAGGNVCYGVNVDASSANLSGAYADALEELRLIDSYSHVFGTTDGGVNAIMAPYCLAESEPYQGHEKTGIICYDQRDVFLMGIDSGACSSSGVVTLDGAFNAITSGVTVKDQVQVYDSDGVYKETLTVTATPTVANVIQTNGDTIYVAGHVFRVLSGRKDDQAVRIGSLGIGERRVSVMWPGYFTAVINDEQLTLPPYYLAAAISGMDSALIASQSFTNYTFSIPGLSNIQLETNHVYKKEQLDEMGGGGIDVLIQDTPISQSVKSRHDLTSNMDAIVHRERSIVKQADTCAKLLRSATNPYVGKYNITDDLLRFLGEVCAGVSSTVERKGIVKELNVTAIERDEVIDDKINFYCEVTVFVAGNYYSFTLLVKTR